MIHMKWFLVGPQDVKEEAVNLPLVPAQQIRDILHSLGTAS
jgi:hypothetical protein